MHDNEDPDRPPKTLWRMDDEGEDEDPLVTLGHMVKLASIGIWRKVALKDRKTRPGMQERSNSDPVLEIMRPVTHADAEDTNRMLTDEPTEDVSNDGPSDPQTKMTTKVVDDEVVAVQTQVVSTVPPPTEEA